VLMGPAWLHAVHAAFPLLAGILAGLGLVALLGAYSIDGRLYVGSSRGVLFRK
jgi:hypothetical protein